MKKTQLTYRSFLDNKIHGSQILTFFVLNIDYKIDCRIMNSKYESLNEHQGKQYFFLLFLKDCPNVQGCRRNDSATTASSCIADATSSNESSRCHRLSPILALSNFKKILVCACAGLQACLLVPKLHVCSCLDNCQVILYQFADDCKELRREVRPNK